MDKTEKLSLLGHSLFASYLIILSCNLDTYTYSSLGQFFFPYRTYLASWPSSPVMATSATASSLSTLPTQIQDYGESIWFVNQPLLQTCYMLFKKNGEKILPRIHVLACLPALSQFSSAASWVQWLQLIAHCTHQGDPCDSLGFILLVQGSVVLLMFPSSVRGIPSFGLFPTCLHILRFSKPRVWLGSSARHL